MTYAEIMADAKGRMEKALDHLKDMLKVIRTSRASTGLVEHIRMDYYGTPTPLGQLASISIPEPRQILIKPFDPSVLSDVTKALLKSDLGITPESDGKVVRLNLPALSGDQRKKYAAKVREICEESRIALRNVRRDLNKHADALRKSSEITDDENHQLHDEIQKLLKQYEDKVGEVQEKKSAEIMEV